MIRGLVAAASAAVLLTFVAPSAASASITFTPGTPTVTAKTSLTSGACRAIPVAVPYTASSPLVGGYASVRVTQGTKTVGQVLMFLDLAGRLRDSLWYCPGVDPLGAMRVGPTSGTYCEPLLELLMECHPFTSAKTTTFAVKQGSRIVSPTSSQSGSTRTFTGTVQFFKVTGQVDAWTPRAAGTKVQLQRRAANGTGAWTTIRTATTSSTGAIRFVQSASRVYQYRLSVPEGTTTWSAVSTTMKR